MSTPGSERQSSYRMWHPQINVTFRNQDEHWTVKRACWRTGGTPREVLLDWAQRILAKPLPPERADKPPVGNSGS
jgi:hypothetical protein